MILGCVWWYCKYGSSYRNLEELMLERGFDVDHKTLYCWAERYAPEIEKRVRWVQKPSTVTVAGDETYVKVKGETYLYRSPARMLVRLK
jgi:IS6 family transposase